MTKHELNEATINALLENYVEVKNALINENLEASQKYADDLLYVASGFKKFKKVEELARCSGNMLNSISLDSQRILFDNLSAIMIDLVESNQLLNKTMYIQYCPKANNKHGAYWLSEEEIILNPYLGKEMLNCGSLKKALSSH